MIDQRIQEYAEKHTSPEGKTLEKLRRKTCRERSDSNMLSGFYQGRLLSMLSKMVRPRRILEIGTYVGYSALCLAEGLTEDGRLITLDVDEKTSRTARKFWGQSELGGKIEPIIGDALKIIPALDETFDLVFIDADKVNYFNYYNLVFPKLRLGGVVIADNVLWGGDVLHIEDGWTMDESARALYAFSKEIQADGRVSNILLAVRDGLMVVRKESD